MNERNLIPPETTVQTSDTGVLAICECEEQRPNDLLIARGIFNSEPGTVYIRRDGVAANIYGTGKMGVSDEEKEAAEADDEPFCEECGGFIEGWLHTT